MWCHPLRMLAWLTLATLETLLWITFVALDYALTCVYYPWFWYRRARHYLTRAAHTTLKALGDEESCPRRAFGPRVGKTVVIVGGNFGGLAALRHLFMSDPSLNVVLVDQREYFEYTPGILRLFCDPRLFSTMTGKSPRGVHEFLQGTVSAVNADHIIVNTSGERPQRLDFDYLILATGADYSRPVTPSTCETSLASRAAVWQKEAAKLKAANSIIVLGGGAVGVELAAEIVCYYPRKRVTIVDALPSLLPLFPQKTAQHAERWFQERGVELVLGEMLEKWDEGSCTTKSGRVIRADVVHVCFGSRCNSQCVASGDMANSLGPRKEVHVNDFLQVNGSSNVFAVGDVMTHPAGEIKQAYYAEMNGTAAAMNIIRHSRGEQMVKYPEALAGSSLSPLVYVVSLGRYDGSLGFNKVVINGVIAALLKWILEWTKVSQMQGRPIGLLIWALGDEFTFFLSRTVLKPVAKSAD